jgi:hypothetical protein
MSVSEKSWSTVTAAVTALRKLFSFAGLLSVPVLAALSISALRNSCWCCMRAKSPRANCLRWRIQSSACVAVHVHGALREHPVRLVDRGDALLHLQVHAAERVGDLLEAAEVDGQHVVEVHVGHALDRVHRARQAAEGERRVDLGAAAAAAVGRVARRDLHPQVARDRDQLRGLMVGRDVHHDQRVRAPGVRVVLDRVRVARVAADQQDVDRAVDRLRRAAAGDLGERVGALEVVVEVVRVAVQREAREQAADHDHAAGHQGDAPQRGLRLPWYGPAGAVPPGRTAGRRGRPEPRGGQSSRCRVLVPR